VDAYSWSISRQGTERFLHLRAAERKKLLNHFDQLAANVHMEPAASFMGSEDEEFAISTLEKHVVTYHVDHAVKLVRIIAVE